jgi:hypothetical protein
VQLHQGITLRFSRLTNSKSRFERLTDKAPGFAGGYLLRALKLLATSTVAGVLSFTIMGALAQQLPSQSASSIATAEREVRGAEALRLRPFSNVT